ncbi:hypothetical protein MB46_07595 [Arthrobacter alpinus]|nr:hypothetical protein MB46_07595 [Arthrobacter alpinus]
MVRAESSKILAFPPDLRDQDVRIFFDKCRAKVALRCRSAGARVPPRICTGQRCQLMEETFEHGTTFDLQAEQDIAFGQPR